MDELQNIVELMLPAIEAKLNTAPSTFKLWFGNIRLLSLTEDRAIIEAPTPLRANILSTKYIKVIRETLAEVLGFEVSVEIVAAQKENVTKIEKEEDEEPEQPTESDLRESSKREEEIRTLITDDAPKESRSVLEEYTFENFIEGSSNKFAKAACLAVAREPGRDYNPLFIHGHSGLGKTHLLCAVVNYLKKHSPNLRIVFKKSEDFINEMLASISNNTMISFKEQYRNADVLLIDDIQFIAGKVSMQEEFFHTFSTLYESGKQIILTSDRPPHEIKPLEDRLRTRFEGGLIADIQPPSQELRTAIIKAKSEALSLNIPNDLVVYMAERLHDNIRQIEGVLKKLFAFYSLSGTVVTKESIDQAISIIDPGNIPVDVLIDRILHSTAKYYGIPVESIKSKKKTDNIASARHIAIYIIRKLTDKSYKEIGEIFGRDHTTVMASCNKVEINIKTVKNTESDIKKIIKDVRS